MLALRKMTCGKTKQTKKENLITIYNNYFALRVHLSSFHERNYVTNTVGCSGGSGSGKKQL